MYLSHLYAGQHLILCLTLIYVGAYVVSQVGMTKDWDEQCLN